MRRAPSNSSRNNQDGPIATSATTSPAPAATALDHNSNSSSTSGNSTNEVAVVKENDLDVPPKSTPTPTPPNNNNNNNRDTDPSNTDTKANTKNTNGSNKAQDKDDAIALLGLAASAPRPDTVPTAIATAVVTVPTHSTAPNSTAISSSITAANVQAATQQQKQRSINVVRHVTLPPTGNSAGVANLVRGTVTSRGRSPAARNSVSSTAKNNKSSVHLRRHHSTPASNSNSNSNNNSRYNVRHHQQQHYGVGVGVGTLPAHQYLMAANVGGVAAGRMDSFYIESLYKQTGGRSTFKYPIDYAVGIAIRKHVLLPILNNNNNNNNVPQRDESVYVQHMKSLFRGEGLWVTYQTVAHASNKIDSIGTTPTGTTDGGAAGSVEHCGGNNINMMQRLITETKARKLHNANLATSDVVDHPATQTQTQTQTVGGVTRHVTYEGGEVGNATNANKPQITKRLVQARLCRASSHPDTTFLLHNWYHYSGDKYLADTSAVWSEWWERKARIQDFGCEMLKLECIPQITSPATATTNNRNGELLGVAYLERSVTDINGSGRVTLLRGMRINPNSNPLVYKRSALTTSSSAAANLNINDTDNDDFVPRYEGVSDMLFRAIVLRSILYGTTALIVNCPKNDAQELFYAKHMGQAVRFTKDGRKVFCLLGADRWSVAASEFHRHLTRAARDDDAAATATTSEQRSGAAAAAKDKEQASSAPPPPVVFAAVKEEEHEDVVVPMDVDSTNKGAAGLESKDEAEQDRKRPKIADYYV